MNVPDHAPFVQRHRYDLIRLRDHLAGGHRCTDAWIAIAHLVHEPWQRLDCLERACAIDPDDQNLQIARLEHYIVLHPDDAHAAEELREAKARRVLERYKPRVFRHQDASQPIGAILRAARHLRRRSGSCAGRAGSSPSPWTLTTHG